MRLLAFSAALLSLAACTDAPRPSDRAVDARVAEATARLAATDAGRRVLAAIDAHGGLATWYRNGPVRWRYRYVRLDSTGAPAGDPLDTRQLVDPWSARAVHTLASPTPEEGAADSTVRFGWTGAVAWAVPDVEAVPTDPRFWALTPYYFVAMPFVLADPGVRLETADTLTVEGTTYDQVRVTFDPGTGDAPDDYYYLLVDPATDRVGAVRYVVSYSPFNPDGGHTPETVMLYDGAQTVGGVTFQEGFRSFLWDGSARGPGPAKARGTLTEVAFAPDTPGAAFEAPAGAEILPDL
jgi:hypothetical protein